MDVSEKKKNKGKKNQFSSNDVILLVVMKERNACLYLRES